MKSIWFCGAAALVVGLGACGSDDDSGSGGSAGSTSGGASGSGAGGATGGVAGGGLGGAAGGADVCSATQNPYGSVDCSTACTHFVDFEKNDGCANPYADVRSSCVAVCDTTKATTTYTNALFGCAAEHATCAAFKQCLKDKCG